MQLSFLNGLYLVFILERAHTHAHVSGGGAKGEWERQADSVPSASPPGALSYNPETVTPVETKSRTANWLSRPGSPKLCNVQNNVYQRQLPEWLYKEVRGASNPAKQQLMSKNY